MDIHLIADSCEFAPPAVSKGTPASQTDQATKPTRRRLLLAALPAMAPLLLGCRPPAEEKLGLEVVGYNHTTNRSLYIFTVDGYPGANLAPETGGGHFTCCVPVANQWRPGLQVRVRWCYQDWRDIPAPTPRWWEAVVTVPRYTDHDFSRLAVHFYPDHKVKVLVTRLAIKHPDYPAELKWDAPTPVDAAVGRPLDIPEPPPPREVDRPELTGAPTPAMEPASASEPATAASAPN